MEVQDYQFHAADFMILQVDFNSFNMCPGYKLLSLVVIVERLASKHAPLLISVF